MKNRDISPRSNPILTPLGGMEDQRHWQRTSRGCTRLVTGMTTNEARSWWGELFLEKRKTTTTAKPSLLSISRRRICSKACFLLVFYHLLYLWSLLFSLLLLLRIPRFLLYPNQPTIDQKEVIQSKELKGRIQDPPKRKLLTNMKDPEKNPPLVQAQSRKRMCAKRAKCKGQSHLCCIKHGVRRG